MNIEGFLQRLVAVLEQVGIPYMLSGSLASAFYGIPRSTQDIDIVVELDITRLRALITALPQEMYYVSEPAAVDALRRQGQFNVIDMETGWKVDLIVRKRRPFSRTEFERRRSEEVLGVPWWSARQRTASSAHLPSSRDTAPRSAARWRLATARLSCTIWSSGARKVIV